MNIRSTIFRSTPLSRALPVVFSSLLVLGSAAQAEGVYVLGSFGQSRFSDDIGKSDKNEFVEETIGVLPTSSSLDQKDTGYKVQVGYQFNQHFAVEGGYTDLGEQIYKARYEDIASGKEKTTAEGWNLDAVLTLPVNSGVSLFAKVGAISAKLERKVSLTVFDDSGSASEKETKVAAKAGVGIAYNFYQAWSARAEFERYIKLGDDEKTGEVDVDLYSVGLSYQF